MSAFHQKRVWFWIAFAAIVIALVGLIVPNAHGNSPDQPQWLALLPVVFVGLIAPLSILPLIVLLTLGYASEAPTLAPSFQRPPPSGITHS
jgi:Na+/H+-dicarboxylate symporter